MSSGPGDDDDRPDVSDDDRPAVGGDDACWLDRVCDRCGGFVEQDGEHICRTSVHDRRPTAPEHPVT